jgi:beta-glucosidase/6-phospho-beta-glucosidase/beta-galactosidase
MRLCPLALLIGCAGPADKGTPDVPVPDGFLFGAAMAGFQVEAGCPTLPAADCEDPHSDWYQWATDPELVAEPGNFLSGDPLSLGPGYWELYEDDHRRAAEELHLDSLRISLEMSRLFPARPPTAGAAPTVDELVAAADPGAVQAYRAILRSMRGQGLEPLVTLNHYTLPLWLHDGKACHEDPDGCAARGWLDGPTMVAWLGAYAGFCARTFGDEVRWWATLNEPMAVVVSGYLLPTADRTNPPGLARPTDAIDVAFAMIDAHAAMYDAVHAEDGDAQVGLVPNLSIPKPEDEARPEDLSAAEHFDHIYNRVFLDALVDGALDRDLDGVAELDRPDLAGRMDYVGINYYTQVTVRGTGVSFVPGYAWVDFLPVGSLWTEHPEGLGDVARLVDSYGLPVIITENGTYNHENDPVGRFLNPHLAALQGAIDDGVDVRGYFLWSLIDNYEWNHGMDLRFGAYEVDEVSKERRLRDIGRGLAGWAEAGALPAAD